MAGQWKLRYFINNIMLVTTGSSESHRSLIKGVRSDVRERLYGPETRLILFAKHFLQICLRDVSYVRSYCSF